MSGLASICISIFVILIIAILGRSLNARNKKILGAQQVESDEPLKPKPSSTSWLWHIGIALFIAFWTVLGALFYLAVVWVLRLNPGPGVSSAVGNNEKTTARRVYTWLFWSPLLTVPFFIIALVNSYGASANEYVLAALLPLVLHAPLLLGLSSNSRFVYRHTQQGLFLIALRAGMASLAAMSLDNYTEAALLLFFFGNGTAWLIGSVTGWSQVSDGKGWFMERKGEKVDLSGATSTKSDNLDIDKELDDMLKSLDATGTYTARQKALRAFQSGTPAIKKRAVAVLTKLGEVEKF